MTDKVYTQQELKEMADQLLAADDKKKAGKAAAQKAEEAKPAADKALEEKLAKCPAAALLAGNSGEKKYLPVLEAWSQLPFEAVAEHARWARERLLTVGLDRKEKTD